VYFPFPISFGFVCLYISQEIGWEDYSRVEVFPLWRPNLL